MINKNDWHLNKSVQWFWTYICVNW